MKICHLADTHLGAGDNHPIRNERGLTLRQEDIVSGFIEAIDKIIAIRPDVVIHAGDIFDTVRPQNRILAIVGEQLHRLAEVAKIPTVIITGNHDAPKQPHAGAALDIFRHLENLHIASASSLIPFTIGNVKIFALPHCLTTEIQKIELKKATPDKDVEFNVLVMHGVAAGMPEFSMLDLGEQEFPLEVMSGFDYTALGHFHNYCQVAPRAWYSGSTERLSQAERTSQKGFVEVELNPFSVRFHEVHTREMVDMKSINVAGKRGDQVVKMLEEQLAAVDSSDKIVRVKLEGATPEMLQTIPGDRIAELKQKSFSLDIRIEKEKTDESPLAFGRSAIGRLDTNFLNFLTQADLQGFDRERLTREALRYLQGDE